MRRYKIINIFQTAVILGSMTGFMLLLGIAVSGLYGLFLALLVALGLIFLYPSLNPDFIARLYGARPLSFEQAPLLYAYAEQLARRAEILQLPRLYLIASPLSIAFSVGQHARSVMILSTALVERLELAETVGVMAHEMAHIANKDLWLMSVTDLISRMTTIFSLVGQIMIFIYLPAFLLSEVEVPWLGILVLLLAPLINILLGLTLSKVREYDADATAAYLLGDPLCLARALEKIDYEEKYLLARLLFPVRRGLLPSLFRTHPLTEARIKKLRSLRLPPHIKPIDFGERSSRIHDEAERQKRDSLLGYFLR